MALQSSNNMSRNNSRNTIPFIEADMDNGCESGACGLAKTFYESQCRLLWRLKTRGELSTFYRSTFDSWVPDEVKSSPGLHRQFAQVMFALVNDGQILRVNKGQYLVWTDPQNPANRRRNQGPQRNNHRGQQGPHRGHNGPRRDHQGPRRNQQGPNRGHQGPHSGRQGPRRVRHESHVCTGKELMDDQSNPPAFGKFSASASNRSSSPSSPRNWGSSDGE